LVIRAFQAPLAVILHTPAPEDFPFGHLQAALRACRLHEGATPIQSPP
jgi:hypothetical protein